MTKISSAYGAVHHKHYPRATYTHKLPLQHPDSLKLQFAHSPRAAVPQKLPLYRPDSLKLRVKLAHSPRAAITHKVPLYHPDSLKLKLEELGDNVVYREKLLKDHANSETKQKPVVKWNFMQKVAAAAIDVIEEKFIVPMESRHPLPKTADPEVQLSGNYAPVDECPVQHNLQIQGMIPECIDGVYVRNGANPRIPPQGGHHLFDGDGMLHAVSLHNGRASYCCRFTKTERLVTEELLGRSIYPKPVGQLHGHGGLARLALHTVRGFFGLIRSDRGMGPANAGVVFFDGKLLALSEDDMPHAVTVTEDGDLRSDGRFVFNGEVRGLRSVIAHPCVDPVTGEMFTLSYDVLRKPYLRLLRFSAAGMADADVHVDLPGPTIIHDFAITEHNVVVPDQQVIFDLRQLLTGGSPVVCDATKTPRFGVMPRYDADDRNMTWIDVPGCFCFHLWNAWESEDAKTVTVIASCMTPPDAVFNDSADGTPLKSTFSEIRLDLDTCTSTRREILPGLNLEAGQINCRFLGRRIRYVYMAVAEPWPRISGIVKVDLHEGRVVCRHDFPQGWYGSEPCFINNDGEEEDDGYLVSFVHDEEGGRGGSELVVLDASKDGGLRRVGAAKLPSRVPYGFHGTFVSRDQLLTQRP